MDFHGHLEHIRGGVLEALTHNKMNLIEMYLKVLTQTASLLDTSAFDFWIRQIEEVDRNEIAVTKQAVMEETKKWKTVVLDKKSIVSNLLDTSESLFTFWIEDDLCETQGQFYYYYDMKLNKIFAESKLGAIKLIEKSEFSHSFRIATISEIKQSGLFVGGIKSYLL